MRRAGCGRTHEGYVRIGTRNDLSGMVVGGSWGSKVLRAASPWPPTSRHPPLLLLPLPSSGPKAVQMCSC